MAHQKSLFKLKAFYLSIIVPIFLSLWLAANVAGLLVDFPSNIWGFSFSGFLMAPDMIFEEYKTPLAIAALTFPFVTLVASNHRSVQAAAQIKLTNLKSNSENYFKHQEYFFNFIEDLTKDKGYTIRNKNKLYSNIFINNSPDEFHPVENNNNVINDVSREFEKFDSMDYNITSDKYKILVRISILLNIIKIDFKKFNEEFVVDRNVDESTFSIVYQVAIRNSLASFINELYEYSSNENKVYIKILK